MCRVPTEIALPPRSPPLTPSPPVAARRTQALRQAQLAGLSEEERVAFLEQARGEPRSTRLVRLCVQMPVAC